MAYAIAEPSAKPKMYMIRYTGLGTRGYIAESTGSV